MSMISFPAVPFFAAMTVYVVLSYTTNTNEYRFGLLIVTSVITAFMYLASYGLMSMV